MIYFYQPDIIKGEFQLPDEEHQHCSKVLRKRAGDEVGIYDGVGGEYLVRLTEVSKKQSCFEILNQQKLPAKPFHHHIAIAPTKNIDRIEWFVEKACELGVDEISFILTKNCERSKIRVDRLEKKAVSALKQSKTGYLTQINELRTFTSFLKTTTADSKYIAVVEPDLPYFSKIIKSDSSVITLIGPEGDFTQDEADQAQKHQFIKISLGKSTLRTETAGLMAGHFINIVNEY